MPSLKCPHCQRVLRVAESAAGKQITCPACSKKFKAPPPPGGAARPKASAPPPVPGEARRWHLHVDGRNVGPYSADAVREQLKAGKIDRSTLVWREGMDDWTPLREVAELRKGTRAGRPGARGAHGDDEDKAERRRHYRPGRAKRDAMIGAWVAVGLGVVLIIVILYLVSQPPSREVTDPGEARLARLRSAVTVGKQSPRAATPPTAAPATAKEPRVVVKKKPKLSNAKLLAKVVGEIDAQFSKCFADPGEADYMQLMHLQRKCAQHATALKERQWDQGERDVERYAGILEETAAGIQSQIKDISQKWAMGREGLPEQAIAEQYPDDIAFLRNWEKAVEEAKAKMKDAGLKF